MSLPETVGAQHCLKIDSFKHFIAVSSGTGLVFMWKCKKVLSVSCLHVIIGGQHVKFPWEDPLNCHMGMCWLFNP